MPSRYAICLQCGVVSILRFYCSAVQLNSKSRPDFEHNCVFISKHKRRRSLILRSVSTRFKMKLNYIFKMAKTKYQNQQLSFYIYYVLHLTATVRKCATHTLQKCPLILQGEESFQWECTCKNIFEMSEMCCLA